MRGVGFKGVEKCVQAHFEVGLLEKNHSKK
jgi:hypothetical protein